MIALRRATPDDAGHAARIIRAALAEYGLPFDPEGRDADVATFGARPDGDDLVAEAEGQVIGVVSVGPHGEEAMGWISKLFVARSARRRGVGRALLEAAHASARRRGFRAVGLRTRIVFAPAIALYEAQGYTRRSDPARVLEEGDVVYVRALG
jgi:putative acetyltransferase